MADRYKDATMPELVFKTWKDYSDDSEESTYDKNYESSNSEQENFEQNNEENHGESQTVLLQEEIITDLFDTSEDSSEDEEDSELFSKIYQREVNNEEETSCSDELTKIQTIEETKNDYSDDCIETSLQKSATKTLTGSIHNEDVEESENEEEDEPAFYRPVLHSTEEFSSEKAKFDTTNMNDLLVQYMEAYEEDKKREGEHESEIKSNSSPLEVPEIPEAEKTEKIEKSDLKKVGLLLQEALDEQIPPEEQKRIIESRFVDVEEEPRILHDANSKFYKPTKTYQFVVPEDEKKCNLFTYLCQVRKEIDTEDSNVGIITIHHILNILIREASSEYILRVTIFFRGETEGNYYDLVIRPSTKSSGKYKPKNLEQILVKYPKKKPCFINFAFIVDKKTIAQTRFILFDNKPVKTGKHFLMFQKNPTMNCSINSKAKGLFAKIRDPALELSFSYAPERDCKKIIFRDFTVLPLCAVDSAVYFYSSLLEILNSGKQNGEAQTLNGFCPILQNEELILELSGAIKNLKKKKDKICFPDVINTVLQNNKDKITPFHTKELIPLRLLPFIAE